MANFTERQSTTISTLDDSTIDAATALLKVGDLVAVPTETVYGLAADALNPTAVAKIFAAKRRPSFDPLIVHIPEHLQSCADLVAAGLIDGEQLTDEMVRTINALSEAFWPGPLTMIIPKSAKIPDLVTSGQPTVGLRMPSHRGLQRLLRHAQIYLAAPSANTFGHVSPTTAQHVYDDLEGRIPLILDDGPCALGIESTIIALTKDGPPQLLRRGAIPIERLKSLAPNLVDGANAPSHLAPGTLDKHYAPRIPAAMVQDIDQALRELDRLRPRLAGLSIALLQPQQDPQFFSDLRQAMAGQYKIKNYELCEDGDSFIAGQNLFKQLRDLEETYDAILIRTPTSSNGLWPAILDRLQKAANTWR